MLLFQRKSERSEINAQLLSRRGHRNSALLGPRAPSPAVVGKHDLLSLHMTPAQGAGEGARGPN